MTPTLRKILDDIEEALMGPDGGQLADVLAALRGPDNESDELKSATTNHIRAAAFPKLIYSIEYPTYDDKIRFQRWDVSRVRNAIPTNHGLDRHRGSVLYGASDHFLDHVIKAAKVLEVTPFATTPREPESSILDDHLKDADTGVS